MRRTLLLSSWLPIGVVVIAAFRFGIGPGLPTEPLPVFVMSLPAMVAGLVVTWAGGIPLTLALQRLHPRSRPLAFVCAAVLCPLSAAAVTVGGLFGPIGIWAYAAIVSVPAWLALGFLVGLAPLRARRSAS